MNKSIKQKIIFSDKNHPTQGCIKKLISEVTKLIKIQRKVGTPLIQ